MQQPDAGGFDQQLKTLQLIIVSLAMGPLLFGAIILLALPGERDEGLLTKVALLGGLGALFLSNPVGRLLRSQTPRQGEPLGPYLIGTIVSAAILEGAVFLNLISYLQERSPWTLAMAALLWLAMIAKTPTRTRVRVWLEQQELRLRDE